MGREKLFVLLPEDFHLKITSVRTGHQPVWSVRARRLAGRQRYLEPVWGSGSVLRFRYKDYTKKHIKIVDGNIALCSKKNPKPKGSDYEQESWLYCLFFFFK